MIYTSGGRSRREMLLPSWAQEVNQWVPRPAVPAGKAPIASMPVPVEPPPASIAGVTNEPETGSRPAALASGTPVPPPPPPAAPKAPPTTFIDLPAPPKKRKVGASGLLE